MRAGPVSAAAMRVPVPAADQRTPFPHAHCDEAEYAAFLDGLVLRPAVRRQRRNHQRRFARLWPDLGSWFSLPLDTRVARRAQAATPSLHHRASYDARSYLYYLGLTDRTRLDYDWLLALGDLRLAEVGRDLHRGDGDRGDVAQPRITKLAAQQDVGQRAAHGGRRCAARTPRAVKDGPSSIVRAFARREPTPRPTRPCVRSRRVVKGVS